MWEINGSFCVSPAAKTGTCFQSIWTIGSAFPFVHPGRFTYNDGPPIPMKSSPRLSLAAIPFLLIALLAGCKPTPSAADRRKKVAFVTNGVASFWTIASAGVKVGCGKIGRGRGDADARGGDQRSKAHDRGFADARGGWHRGERDRPGESDRTYQRRRKAHQGHHARFRRAKERPAALHRHG